MVACTCNDKNNIYNYNAISDLLQEDEVVSGAIAETPISADCTVTSSLGTTEDPDDVDSDSKGKRFLKNHNSWVSSDPESATLTTGGEGTILLIIGAISLLGPSISHLHMKCEELLIY